MTPRLARRTGLLCLFLAAPAPAQSAEPAEPSPPPPSYPESPSDESQVEQPAQPRRPAREVPPPPRFELTEPEPIPPDVVPIGAERHDGFFLRFALGPAALHMERSTEGELYGRSGDGPDSQVSGAAGMSELSIGGTPAAGLVVAGTLLSHQIAEPVLETDGDSDADLGGPLSFLVLGATVDWYPNPKKGFHFGGTLGLAGVVADSPDGSPFDRVGGTGGALSLQVGHDWWIADEWSLGVLGRLTGARVQGEETARVNSNELEGKEDSNVSAAGVLFSVVYH
jgi:hypothetical protein